MLDCFGPAIRIRKISETAAIFILFQSDWLLKFMYRTFSMATGVAGLQPIKIKDRRFENVDLTDIVSGKNLRCLKCRTCNRFRFLKRFKIFQGHGDYPRKIGAILKLINIRTLDETPLTFDCMKKSASDIPHFGNRIQVGFPFFFFCFNFIDGKN